MPKGKANEPIVESNEVCITVFYNCIIQNNEYLVKLNSRSEKNTSKCLADKQMITVDDGESEEEEEEEEEEKNDLDLKIIYFEKMRSIVINSIAISQRNDYGIDNLLSKHLFLKPTDTSRDLSKPGAAAAKWFTKAVLVDENDVFFTGSSYIFIIVPKLHFYYCSYIFIIIIIIIIESYLEMKPSHRHLPIDAHQYGTLGPYNELHLSHF